MPGRCGMLIWKMAVVPLPMRAHSCGRVFDRHHLFCCHFEPERSGVEESWFSFLVAPVREIQRSFVLTQDDTLSMIIINLACENRQDFCRKNAPPDRW